MAVHIVLVKLPVAILTHQQFRVKYYYSQSSFRTPPVPSVFEDNPVYRRRRRERALEGLPHPSFHLKLSTSGRQPGGSDEFAHVTVSHVPEANFGLRWATEPALDQESALQIRNTDEVEVVNSKKCCLV